jgi:hypothetical protein
VVIRDQLEDVANNLAFYNLFHSLTEMKFEQIALGYASFQNPEWKTISKDAKIFFKNLIIVWGTYRG